MKILKIANLGLILCFLIGAAFWQRSAQRSVSGFSEKVQEKEQAEIQKPFIQEKFSFASEKVQKGNLVILSFSDAKKKLRELYKSHPFDFYCGCQFSDQVIDLTSCGYKTVRQNNQRAYRVEWEHIVPAENFGRSFKEWREGHGKCIDGSGRSFKGRRCAQKTSQEFRMMEADLYNLVPSVGEVNEIRSNKQMGMVIENLYDFGRCKVKSDKTTFEPADEGKGFVARTYMYMNDAYPSHGIISRKNHKLFEAWSKMYPPSVFEKQRAEEIQKIQRNINSFISAKQ